MLLSCNNTILEGKIAGSNPVTTWIADKTISEAKSLFQNSSLPGKEITYRLGFPETVHFSNYFKKHLLFNTEKSIRINWLVLYSHILFKFYKYRCIPCNKQWTVPKYLCTINFKK